MSQALKTGADLYEADYVAWIERQVQLLREGHLGEVDLPNLIEELEGMARKERWQLHSRLEVLLLHLLNRDHQPRRRSRSWNATIVEQRLRIRDLLEGSPSLTHGLEEVARRAYTGAVKRAAAETGLRRNAFPAALPYSLERILGDDEEAGP